MEHVAGTQNEQYDRTFTQGGPYGAIQGNLLIGSQGQNATIPAIPSQEQLSLIQRAGRKSRMRNYRGGKRHSRRIKRGGLVGEVINQAVVPLTLLGLQQNYKRKSHKNLSKKYRN
jgi:hypothetical protein